MRRHRFEQPLESKLPYRRNNGTLYLNTWHLDYSGAAPDKILELSRQNNCEATLMAIRDKFHKAKELVAVCGTYGLGDCIIDVRYAIHLAKQVKKPMICQVNAPLLPLLAGWQKELPHVKFVAKVPPAVLQKQDTFFFMPSSDRTLGGYYSIWLDIPPKPIPPTVAGKVESALANLDNQHSILDSGRSMPSPSKKHLDFGHLSRQLVSPDWDQTGLCINDLQLAAHIAALGVPINESDIDKASILPVSAEIIRRVPQDLDFLIAPDALEQESDNNERSRKSLSLNAWADVFARFDQSKKVAILIGTAHTEYCHKVVKMAQKAGLKVEIIEGSLDKVAMQMLRAKTFVGMDSGTTHLALDVKRAAKAAGRQINIKEIIKGNGYFLHQYALPGINTLVFNPNAQSDLGSMEADQAEIFFQYINKK